MTTDTIQFIAYDINTAPKDPQFNAHLMPSGTYLGLANPRQDIDARCMLLQRAMDTAAANLKTVSPPVAEETLKIFMAPEFFFRGNTGAYQMDDVSYAISCLQELAAAPQWERWVFVFGSLVAMADGVGAVAEAYNFVLVQQGGAAAQGDAGARVVMKELMSGIDFVSEHANPGGVLLGGVEYLQAGGAGAGRERQQVNYDGAGIFELAGLNWAVEVCLDHGASRLQRSPQLPGEPLVQLQLVPSCGMTVTQNAIITGDEGWVFNCDGGGGGSSVNGVTLAGSPPVRQLHAVTAQLSLAVDDAVVELPSSPPVAVSVDQLFASGAGKVVLYPPLASPPQQFVPGTSLKLPTWQAAKGVSFNFELNYGVDGGFNTLMCRATLDTLDLHNHDYFMPMQLSTLDRNKAAVRIAMRQMAGTGEYHGALWCDIDVPGFRFHGVAIEYYSTQSGGTPDTVW